MEKLVSTDLPFASSGKSLALAIKGGPNIRDLRHLSFVYATSNGVKQLHLGFHKNLYWHNWSGNYHCYEFNGIDPIVQETFAEHLEALAAANFGEECNISYSGVYEDDLRYFDADMKYVDNGVGSGLTCATFVLAVMKAFGLQLVRAETWPRNREQDRRWFDWILGELAKLTSIVGMELHVAKQRSYRLLLRRFRPEEVAATSIHYVSEPLTFRQLEPESKTIRSRLPCV